MKQRRIGTVSGVSPVLYEMTVMLLFLGVCAAVVMQLIAGAHTTAERSAAESLALLQAESYLEAAKADPAAIVESCDDSCEHEKIYYDRKNGIQYVLLVQQSPTPAGWYYTIDITAQLEEETLLTLSTGRYIARGEGDG